MTYSVKAGDSLSLIAKETLGNPDRWPEIAKLNRISFPDRIFVGQKINLPDKATGFARLQMPGQGAVSASSNSPEGRNRALMAGRALFFVVVQEVEPSGKLVRKVVMLPETDLNALVVNRPDLFGLHPRQPGSAITPGEHALGDTLSRYISASQKPNGAPNFPGTEWYIDIAKTKRAGARIVSTDEIVKDLDRLGQLHPHLQARIAKLKGVIDAVEGEVLIDGSVPKGAIQTAEQAARELTLLRGMAGGARVLGGIGIVLTVYDLGQAGVQSYQTHSIKPIARESFRQAGGWGGAWLGFQAGLEGGLLLGIETGPGALAFGLAGGLILGTICYFGGDAAAKRFIK